MVAGRVCFGIHIARWVALATWWITVVNAPGASWAQDTLATAPLGASAAQGESSVAPGGSPLAPGESPGAPPESPTAGPPASASGDVPGSSVRFPPAVLIFQNRTIATFRSPFAGYAPQERVESAQRRIRELLKTRDPGPITTESVPQGLAILVGGKLVFGLQTQDLDVLAGETLEEEGRRAAQVLGEAIAAWREQRSLTNTLIGIVQALVATALLVILLKFLRTLELHLRKRLTALASRHLGQVERSGLTLVDRQRALRATDRGAGFLAWVVRLILLFSWMTFLLSRFPYTAPWGEALGRRIGNSAGDVAIQILHGIPGLLTVALILIFTRFLVGLVRLVMAAVESGQMSLPWIDAEVAAPARRLLVLILWLGAVVMAYPYIPGSDSLAFKGIGLLFGLMASLGGSRLIGHAISGFVVMFARSIRKGEVVRIGETEGLVTAVSLMSVRLKTMKNEEITIPASLVLDSVTKNFSRLAATEHVYIYTSVTIGYNAPWRQVHAMLMEAARRTRGLKQDPPPFVLQTAMSDFYVEYQINAAIEIPTRRYPVLTELHQNIQDCFNEHGVQIMSPHYEGDPAEKVWVPKERWFEPPAPGPEGGGRTDG